MFITAKIFEAVLISLIATIVCVPPGIWLARRVDLIDYPGAAPHKHHARPTPMAGGIILVLAFVVGWNPLGNLGRVNRGSHFHCWVCDLRFWCVG